MALRGRPPKCKRRGCGKTVPKLARLHDDPYCSNDCCRVDHGLDPARDLKRTMDGRRKSGK